MTVLGRSFAAVTFLIPILILAACGGAEEERTDSQSPLAGRPAPEPAASPADDVIHAALIGQWAPNAEQCRMGARLNVSATMLTNTQTDATTCTIVSSELDGNVITVVGTCSPTPGILENVTFALAAEIVADAPVNAMEMIQGGMQPDGPFEQQLHLVRCAGPAP